MQRKGSWDFVVLVALAAGACGLGSDAGPVGLGPTVLDSAGVQIVINRVPSAGMPVYAVLDSVQDLELGYTSGDQTSFLLDVEGVATLSNGNVAVANGSSYQIRYYGPDGTWLGWVGEQGFDPGEFWELSRMGRAGGDTLWAADNTRHRLTVFERASDLVSTYDMPADYTVSGRFGDGSYLLVPQWPLSFHRESPVDGVRRDPARYLRWWPESGDTTGVGVFPHDQMLVVETDRGLSVGVPPFGRKTVRAVGPGRFYVGEQEGFVINGYDPDGSLRQSIRLNGVDLSLTPQQVARTRAKASDERAEEVADRFWAAVPDTRPAYSSVRLDAAGNLWVAEHVAGLGQPRNWIVFAPDGALRGLVTVPAGFEVQEIGLRYIVGVRQTPVGDERVVRYRMARTR